MGEDRIEDLYRRLAQSRRLASGASDSVTIERIKELVADLERELAVVEARDADAPPT